MRNFNFLISAVSTTTAMREDAQQQQERARERERERVRHKYHEISAWVEAWPEDDICAYTGIHADRGTDIRRDRSIDR